MLDWSLSVPRLVGEGCTNRATIMVGAKVYVRVCDRCATDPCLKRYKVRRRILGSGGAPDPAAC